MDHKDIGNTIRLVRKQSGLSQQQLAEIAGVGKTVVFDIEKGKPTVQLNSLLKILAILNIELQLKIPISLSDEQTQ